MTKKPHDDADDEKYSGWGNTEKRSPFSNEWTTYVRPDKPFRPIEEDKDDHSDKDRE